MLTAGLRYSSGPLRAALTYERLNPKRDSNKRNAQNYQLGVSYDFDVVKAFAGFNEQRNINANPTPGYIAAGNRRDRAYSLGFSVPTGKSGTTMLTYQRAVLSKNHGFAAAYRHQLSKRTSLYAMGNLFEVRNHATATDHNKRQFGAGIQHAF